MIRNLKDIDIASFQMTCEHLREQVSNVLLEQGIRDFTSVYEIDLRYRGQATNLPVMFEMAEVLQHGFAIFQKRRVCLTPFLTSRNSLKV
jgi:hypothetical protein